MNEVNTKINVATKWSLCAEILSKLVPPITNMILARLLTPSTFGMVATITMITSFADLFTDAGFQKYLIQREFNDEEEYEKCTNVAFWTNLGLSLFLWMIIFIARDSLARIVGNPGLGNSIAVAAICLPLTSFSSIQIARYRKALDFRTLFFLRLVGLSLPILVTVPLAFILRNYWALIFGNLSVSLANACLLTFKSPWKPRLFYDFKRLKEMIAFCIWTLVEQLLGWANLNIGIFIVGVYLSDYYLGLYKTSMAYVNQVMGIIVNSLSPILLSALSKLKNNRDEFYSFFYRFEKKVSMVILPLGVGIFVYRRLFTEILLGNQWTEAASFIGFWALMRALLIVFGLFSLEVFVASGKPKYGVITQILQIAILIPVLVYYAKIGYEPLYKARCYIVLWYIFCELLVLYKGAKISVATLVKNSLPYMAISILMGCLGLFLVSILDSFLSIFICIIFYFGILVMFKGTRSDLYELISSIKKK